MNDIGTEDLTFYFDARFEKIDQKTLDYDENGQPTFMTGNIGMVVGLRPLDRRLENPDPNADMILPEDGEDEKEAANSEEEETKNPGGLLVATVRIHC